MRPLDSSTEGESWWPITPAWIIEWRRMNAGSDISRHLIEAALAGSRQAIVGRGAAIEVFDARDTTGSRTKFVRCWKRSSRDYSRIAVSSSRKSPAGSASRSATPLPSGDVTSLARNVRQRYSRALLETLALIAYRQPITRAEIEEGPRRVR